MNKHGYESSNGNIMITNQKRALASIIRATEKTAEVVEREIEGVAIKRTDLRTEILKIIEARKVELISMISGVSESLQEEAEDTRREMSRQIVSAILDATSWNPVRRFTARRHLKRMREAWGLVDWADRVTLEALAGT